MDSITQPENSRTKLLKQSVIQKLHICIYVQAGKVHNIPELDLPSPASSFVAWLHFPASWTFSRHFFRTLF